MDRDVVIACDFPTKNELFEFLSKLGNEKPYLKIGMEMYYAEGAQIIYKLKSLGFKIFLDLKLHDIPNTVKSAMKVLASLDIDMCNVHAAGGIKMMSAAAEGLTKPDGSRAKLIAVTQLTSTSQEMLSDELMINMPVLDCVLKYAENVKNAGLDGVVCSPLEAGSVKERCGSDFIALTPGIRFAGGDNDDQSRVTTPAKAKELGSDYIVVGRPITRAADPLGAYLKCVKDFI